VDGKWVGLLGLSIILFLQFAEFTQAGVLVGSGEIQVFVAIDLEAESINSVVARA
jgi:hypothetical protein